MAARKHTTSIRLEDNPPRPASGDGEVVVSVGNQDVTVRWEKGKVIESRAASDEGFAGDIQMKADGVIQCYKCWVDTETGAWICLPTAC
jgi:hypothetical protein